MYALGEIIERVSTAEFLGAHLYTNSKGIRQRLPEDHVELITDKSVDSDQKQA